MIKVPQNVKKFAQDKVDIYKAFADYFNHYATENYGKKFSYDQSISLEEKSKKMDESLRKEIARVAGVQNFSEFAPEVWASNPNFKWATFAVVGAMIDMILPTTLIDSIGLYTDIRFGGFGDSFSFEVKPRDLFIVSKAGRGKKKSEAYKQFSGQVTVTPQERDITVEVSLMRVLAGKESLAEFAMKAVLSIETQMTLDTYKAFTDMMSALPTTPTDGALKISGYSQAAAVKLAQTVTAFNQGAKAVFVGTQLALANILPANANYRYMLDSDYVKIGYVQDFNGFSCMVLPQVADYKNPFKLALDDKKIYVISPSSQKLVKLCVEGSTLAITDDTYANANLTQETTMKKYWDTGIATNAVAGVIELA